MATFPTTAPERKINVAAFDSSGFAPLEARLRRARLGMLVAIVGIIMIFISLTSAYVVRQGLPTFDPRTNSLQRDWLRVPLPMLLVVNTVVLLISSITMELARRQAARDLAAAAITPINRAAAKNDSKISWLALTILLGLSFLAGQLIVWRELGAAGFYLATTPSSSFVYLLTGMHGVHLFGGILALLVASVASLLRRAPDSQYVVVDVTGWYWHFVTILWLYLLCLLKFVN
jgi:cytochrome c oxidase subunit III